MTPEELDYTAEHEWMRTEGSRVTIGITDFAQDALGDVVFVDLPEVGDDIIAGETFGEVESTKSVSDLYAPLSGTIVEVNENLESAPELVNSDPYGAGWMLIIEVAADSPREGILTAAEYDAATKES